VTNVRLIPLNAAGGAMVQVLATRWVRRMDIIEDGSIAVPTGLIYMSILDNFTTVFQVAPQTEPIILQNSMSQGRGVGPILGFPAQTGGQATGVASKVFQATSATAAATTIRVTEFD
jgi:hypothetical protein